MTGPCAVAGWAVVTAQSGQLHPVVWALFTSSIIGLTDSENLLPESIAELTSPANLGFMGPQPTLLLGQTAHGSSGSEGLAAH